MCPARDGRRCSRAAVSTMRKLRSGKRHVLRPTVSDPHAKRNQGPDYPPEPNAHRSLTLALRDKAIPSVKPEFDAGYWGFA